MDKPVEELSKIIDNLKLLVSNEHSFSQIEKDIVLQKLREAYLILINYTPGEIASMEPTITYAKEQPVKEEKSNVRVEEHVPVPEDFYHNEEEDDDEAITRGEPESEPEPEEEYVPELIPEKELIPEFKAEPEEISIPEPVLQMEAKPEFEPIPEINIIKQEPENDLFERDDDILEFLPRNLEPDPPKHHPKNVTAGNLFEQLSEQEKFTPKRSLNDVLAEQKIDNSLNTKYHNSKITDLTKSISINDKFLFIKELFKNRGEEFSQSIQCLNNCQNIEEAFSVMEKLKKHYFWDSTSPAYLSLCDLVRRKF